MKNIILSLSITLSFLFSSCAQQKNEFENRLIGIESEIEKLIEEYQAAGVAVAVVKDGESIFTKGFGYRDYENKLPVNEHTVFGIGSCTKAFTASLMGILEGEGKINLSDKPSQYIPELSFYDNSMNEEIKLHHLLSHSVGISGSRFDTSTVLFLPESNELVKKLKYFKQTNPIGEKFNYNNSLYGISGIVTEKVTGNSWDENISQMIFKPLEMKNSYTKYNNANLNSNFSYGYAVNSNDMPERVLPELIKGKLAAGAIYSTIEDMAKWTQVWIDEGVHNGKQIIPKQYINEATQPKQKISNNLTYGYGWIMQNIQGYQTIEHSGAISGYTSNVVMIPSKKIGLVILTNQTVSNISNKITNSILERLLEITIDETGHQIRFERKPNITLATINTTFNNDNPPSFSLSELEGDYFNPSFGNIKISLQDNTLYADFPLTKMRLQHQEGSVFIDYFTEEIPLFMNNYMEFSFGSNNNGEISQVSVNLDETPVIFKLKK